MHRIVSRNPPLLDFEAIQPSEILLENPPLLMFYGTQHRSKSCPSCVLGGPTSFTILPFLCFMPAQRIALRVSQHKETKWCQKLSKIDTQVNQKSTQTSSKRSAKVYQQVGKRQPKSRQDSTHKVNLPPVHCNSTFNFPF